MVGPWIRSVWLASFAEQNYSILMHEPWQLSLVVCA